MGHETNFCDQRQVWQALFATDSAAQAQKEKYDELSAIFPGTIRDWIEDFATRARNGETFQDPLELLNQVHPRAWELLLVYGQDYRPHAWDDTVAHADDQPRPGQCFANTHRIIGQAREKDPLNSCTYVEGIALSALVKPMLHAWNGDGFSVEGRD